MYRKPLPCSLSKCCAAMWRSRSWQLDLCAAPGGKSTLLRSLLPEGSLLVIQRAVRARAQVLAENMTKWGHADVVVTNSYPEDFGKLSGVFDVVVTDVPCSGEGMFRKEGGCRDGLEHGQCTDVP